MSQQDREKARREYEDRLERGLRTPPRYDWMADALNCEPFAFDAEHPTTQFRRAYIRVDNALQRVVAFLRARTTAAHYEDGALGGPRPPESMLTRLTLSAFHRHLTAMNEQYEAMRDKLKKVDQKYGPFAEFSPWRDEDESEMPRR